ncbi:hypothetical protein JTE90_027314 [Oedothorax gibbosus]|uniref:Uncharacterized protein n=1 Tax=Oedothorax gibbosus TaxID=931172 RepID=A0AAV6W3X2_9ARAC|nr:hypothetical protein JTE90_027314 [Oedothorax gibbosus]
MCRLPAIYEASKMSYTRHEGDCFIFQAVAALIYELLATQTFKFVSVKNYILQIITKIKTFEIGDFTLKDQDIKIKHHYASKTKET